MARRGSQLHAPVKRGSVRNGDGVIVIGDHSNAGAEATVVDSNWNDRVKVRMVTGLLLPRSRPLSVTLVGVVSHSLSSVCAC